jgi:hypothetical protein
MFILIYGSDGTGKSVQCKSIAESSEFSEHWSFAVKNRKLYETSGVPSIELLSFNSDSTINPYKTIDNFHDRVTKVIKENTVKLIVIDEITLLRHWAQPVVVEEQNRVRRAYNKPLITKLGEDNAAAWARVNDLVYGELERLATWLVINDATIIAITSITEQRRLTTDDEGKQHSQTTGGWICDAKINIRKLADVIVRLEKDGSKGKGYFAFIEKTQDWMTEGKSSVKVDKTGLATEFVVRGVLG